MSRFMTRPDVKKAKLPEFIDWTLKCIDKADCKSNLKVEKNLGITILKIFICGGVVFFLTAYHRYPISIRIDILFRLLLLTTI